MCTCIICVAEVRSVMFRKTLVEDVKADNSFTQLHILQRGEHLGGELDFLPKKKIKNKKICELCITSFEYPQNAVVLQMI